jgi:ferredoxin
VNQDIRKKPKIKAEVLRADCVACGTCSNICPMFAIRIIAGVYAQVDPNKCVGCAKCAKECPASVIEMVSREAHLSYAE